MSGEPSTIRRNRTELVVRDRDGKLVYRLYRLHLPCDPINTARVLSATYAKHSAT